MPRVEEDVQSQEIKLLGQVEGMGRQGKFEEAGKKLDSETGNDRVKLRGRVALAACAIDAGAREPADLQKAIDLYGRARLPWEGYRIVAMGVRAGLPAETLRPVASNLDPAALRGRAQLLLFRSLLERSPKGLPDSALEEIDAKSLSHAVARLLLAEHNTRHGGARRWRTGTKPTRRSASWAWHWDCSSGSEALGGRLRGCEIIGRRAAWRGAGGVSPGVPVWGARPAPRGLTPPGSPGFVYNLSGEPSYAARLVSVTGVQ